MESLSIQKAQKFLDENFKTFLDKKREAGYNCEIILHHKESRENDNYFYIQFRKENESSKCYKVVC